MATELEDYDLWRRIVDRLIGEGAPMVEAIEGADLILHAHRRSRGEAKRAPPEADGDVSRVDWAPVSEARPASRQTERPGE